jgi:very-short-patch-repair endonuclease
MRSHPELSGFAKDLRRNATDAERSVWSLLRRKQVDGLKFRRQVVLGPFIVDFACLQRRLVIEVDGGQHAGSDYDARRDAWLELNGFRVLRIWNCDALERDNCRKGGGEGWVRAVRFSLLHASTECMETFVVPAAVEPDPPRV